MDEKLETARPGFVAKRFKATPAEKAEWAKRFVESGLSLRKFSTQHALPRQSLWRWVSRSRKPGPEEAVEPASSSLAAFKEIKLAAGLERSNWSAELSFPNGIVLRLSKDVPPGLLEQLLRVC